ncbi:MAG: hypothetical protein IKL68_00370 [Clostridia bacterium]|nr:hypothetical protein [Clostridia bacterium]
MICFERKKIESWSTPNGCMGHITLERLAKPETVKVMLNGEEIIPISFNAFGHPNFSEEQDMLFMFKKEALSRAAGKHVSLEADVTYEERVFDVPRASFDTKEGINKSITSLKGLRELLNNRSMYLKVHPKERLNEFVIFNCFWLDQFAQVMSLENPENTVGIKLPDVVDMDIFRRYNSNLSFSTGGRAIPTEDAVCPCCGKAFTLEDVKRNTAVYVEGKYYHRECRLNYEHLHEIDRLTRILMDIVYDYKDYTFDLLPNGYCSRGCCNHLPWLLCHTPDGDIIIGWRKRVISIEWQENYKPFDMNELFADENVTKWIETNKCGIHAWGREKAYEYLKKVREKVNPDYKK